MARGVFYAVFSMALWGLAFVLPLFVLSFSSGEIALGRFLTFGIASLIFAGVKYKGRLCKLPWKFWRHSVVFALASSLLYYLFLVMGIRHLGGPLATALCSFLPIASSIYGNYCHRVYPWKILGIPLAGIFLGLFLMHMGELQISAQATALSLAFGVFVTLGAVALWSWYSVKNALFLHKYPEVDPSDWVTLMGIFSLIGGVLGGVFVYFTSPESLYFLKASRSELWVYVVAALINGFFVSWLTNLLWNKASRLLPIAFISQLSVFEILFGLLYVYLKGLTVPSSLELLGIACIAVALSISFRRVPTFEIQEDLTKS